MTDETPAVPLWLDLFLMVLWGGVIATSVVGALAWANIFYGVALLCGGGAALLALRTMVKKIRTEWG